jgi:hypothetical protein
VSAIQGNPQPGGGLRPLGVGEMLDASFRVYREHAVTLWKIVAVVVIPLIAIQTLLRGATLPSGVYVHNGGLYQNSASGQTSAGGSAALLIVSFLGVLAELLATGAVFKLLLDAYFGRQTDMRESFQYARERVFSLLWLGILATVLALIGLFLLILPGVWFLVASAVAVPALMLEGERGWKAIQRSMHLVRGFWWGTFGRLLAAALLYIAALIVLSLIVGVLARGLNITSVGIWLAINGALSAAFAILLAPFTAAVITTLYIDLRVRKEPGDMQRLAFEAPASPLPAGPSSTAPEPGASPADTPGSVPPPAWGAPPEQPPQEPRPQ